MYQLDVLAVAHIQEMRREADEARLAAKSLAAGASPQPRAASRIAAGALLWAGKRLTTWGNQLQREDRRPAFN